MGFGIKTKSVVSKGNIADHKVLLEEDLLP